MINTEGASVTIKMSAPYPPVEQPYPPQNQPYPPQNQPNMAAYPPQTGIGYPAYPPPAQAAYPPPTQAAYYPPPESGPMASMPPPPSYDSATAQPPPSYHAAAPKSGPDYGSADVGYSGEEFSNIVNFSNKSVRRGFIRKVFCILTLQLLTTVAAICVFMFVDPVKAFMRTSNGQAAYFASFGIFIALYIVLVCCDNVRRSHPANLIALSLFTISLSFMVGTISSYYETNIVLILMGVTALVCASVIIFSCQTKYDFTTWGGVLFCAALALFFLSIFTPLWLALNTTAGKIILGGFLALLFVAFLAYDVQLIMGGKKYELSPEEYIFASLTLYMDIVRIFLLLLALFGRGSS